MPPPVESSNNEQSTPIRSGGGTSALDPASEADRGLVRRAVRDWPKRWRGLTDSIKDEFTTGLVEAGRVARSQLTDPEKSLDAAKVLGSIVKTAATMEAQIQADDHLEDKNARLDAGLSTENVAHKIFGKEAPTEAV